MNHFFSLIRLSTITLALIALPAVAETPSGLTSQGPGSAVPVPGRAWIGVRIQVVDEATAKMLNLGSPHGALLVVIDPTGPAKPAGLIPGDVIVKFDGKSVQDAYDLPRIVSTVQVGREVEVTIVRDGKEQVHLITLGRLNEGDKQTTPASPSANHIKQATAASTIDNQAASILSQTEGSRNLPVIKAAPCEQILDFYEAGAHRSGADGLRSLQSGFGILKSDFGRPEASAMFNRVKECTNNAPSPDIRRRFLYVVAGLGSMFDARNGDLAGIEAVEHSRKTKELAATTAARDAEISANNINIAKNNAKKINEEITLLSQDRDLITQYNSISEIKSEINKLPANMRADILDELQIARGPIDKKIGEVIASFRIRLIDIQNFNTNEEKLRALGALAKDVAKLPGNDAGVLTSTIDSMRSSIRAEMEVASKASSSVEIEKLQAIQNEEKAKTERQEQAIRKIEDENAPASCKKFQKEFLAKGPLFDEKKTAMLPTLLGAGQTSEACAFINQVVNAAADIRDAANACSKDADEKLASQALQIATYFNGFADHWARIAANEAKCSHQHQW